MTRSATARLPWHTLGLALVSVLVLLVPWTPGIAGVEGHLTFARSSGRSIDLYSVSLPDGGLERHTEGPGTSTSPAWSPDGRLLAYARRVGSPYNLWVLAADSGELSQVTRGTAIDGHPSWAPDGSRLAFASNRASQAGFDVYTVEPDGTELRRLGPGRSPAWSPLGTSIAIVRDGDLVLIDPSTGVERRRFPTTEADDSPSWSPDGHRIAFVRSRGSTSDLLVIDVRDGDVRRLTRDRARDSAPSWSPDGRWIAISRSVGDDTDLYVVEAETARSHQVTEVERSDVTPTWRPVIAG